MVQVQLRVPEGVIKQVDKMIAEGKFKSRSDALRTILALYEEREKTRMFYKMLVQRSKEARGKPEILVPLKELE